MHPHRSNALCYASAASAAHSRVYGACAAEAAASETSGLSVGGCIRAWRYFGPYPVALQKFTFARCGRTSRGGSAPRPRAHRHISAKQSAHAAGGTACADCLTAIWSCDPRRRRLPPFGALHMAPPPHAV